MKKSFNWSFLFLSIYKLSLSRVFIFYHYFRKCVMLPRIKKDVGSCLSKMFLTCLCCVMSLHCGHSASDKLLHQSLLVCQGPIQGNSCDGRSAADKRWQPNMQHLEREAAEWNRSRCRRATVLSDYCFSFLCTSERDIRRLHVFAARNTKPTSFSSTGNGINVELCVVSKLTE